MNPSYNLLIVEADLANRERYQQYLLADPSASYSVETVASVAEGCNSLSRRGFDVVILGSSVADDELLTFFESLAPLGERVRLAVVVITATATSLTARAMKLMVRACLSERELTPARLLSAIVLELARNELPASACADLFRSALDSLLDCAAIIWAIRDRTGSITDFRFDYLNPAAVGSNRVSADDIGRSLCEVFPPIRQLGLLPEFCQVVETGAPFDREDLIYTDVDGKPQLTQAYDVRMSKLDDGIVMVWRDITERKQAELALQSTNHNFHKSDQELRIGIEVAGVALARFDYTTDLVTLSPQAAAMYGFAPDKLAVSRDRLHATFHPDEFAELMAIISQVLDPAGAGWFERDHRVVWPSGEVRWLSVRKQIFFEGSGALPQPSYAILAAIDITDRKRIEAALEARNHELDSFVYTVSHDLKAPLRAVANLAKWIEEDIQSAISDNTQQQLNTLQTRIKRMSDTIDGLLEYARAGRTKAQIEPVAVAELLMETIDSLAPPPTFTISFTPNLPSFNTKRLLLSQVFANLIGNAIKHHDRSDGSVSISVAERGDFYEFAIADDGPGIAVGDLDAIFTIFKTGNQENRLSSSGIGLAIVKKIVEAEAGTIEVESQVGNGTTFYFTWLKQPRDIDRG